MPRLGLGMPISSTASSAPVTTIDDFFFESDTSGEVTPIYTASRKQFARNNNDVGMGVGITKDTSITVPPGQTGTAIRVTETTTTGQHFAQTFIDEVTAGDTYTMSLYVKSTYSSIIIYTNTSQISSNVTVNFTNGTIATSALRAGIEDAGGGWYRVNWTQVAQGSGVSSIYLVVKDLSSYTGSTSNFTDYFGMQVEQDSRASSFMPNTTSDVLTVTTTLNDTSEVWDFDGTDIMLEADPEDEGFWEEGSNLVLNHNFEDLGSELVTCGNFECGSPLSDWSVSGTVTIANGVASFVDDGTNTNSGVAQSVLTANKNYKITFDVTRYAAGQIQITSGAGTYDVNITGGKGVYTTYVQSGSSTQFRIKRNGGSPNFDFDIDNVSVKQVDPNDRWTLGTGWSISDGKARYDASSGSSYTFLGQASLFPGAGDYEITFTLGDLGGSFAYNHAGIVVNGIVNSFQGFGISSAGTHTVRPSFDGSNLNLNFYGHTSGGDFSIDNVTVREYAIQPQDV